jgi:hypothetical protein
MLRWRPGARRKGIPAKVTDAQSRKAKEKPVEAPARRLSAEEAEGLERAGPLGVAWWVLGNLNEKKCPLGASGKAETLWWAAKANEKWFVMKYLPPLLKAEQAKEKAEVDHGAIASKALIDQWMELLSKGAASVKPSEVNGHASGPTVLAGHLGSDAHLKPSTNGHHPAISKPTTVSTEPSVGSIRPAPTILPAPPVPKQPTLCAHCRQYGYALHQECELANNPELKLENGILWRTLHP